MRPVNRAPRLVSEGNFELKFVASILLLIRPILFRRLMLALLS